MVSGGNSTDIFKNIFQAVLINVDLTFKLNQCKDSETHLNLSTRRDISAPGSSGFLSDTGKLLKRLRNSAESRGP